MTIIYLLDSSQKLENYLKKIEALEQALDKQKIDFEFSVPSVPMVGDGAKTFFVLASEIVDEDACSDTGTEVRGPRRTRR